MIYGEVKRGFFFFNELEINMAVNVRWGTCRLYLSLHLYLSATAEAGTAHNVCVSSAVCINACVRTSFTFSALLHPLANYTQGLFGGGREGVGRRGACQPFLFMIKWQKIIGGSSTPLQPSTAPKTPAAVQKVPGVGSLPFNETIKGPVSPSIDFSHSFSDKFELIIQCQAPGDVYFQHEGQLIHSVTPPTPLSLTPSSLLHSLILHLPCSLPPPVLRSHLMMEVSR